MKFIPPAAAIFLGLALFAFLAPPTLSNASDAQEVAEVQNLLAGDLETTFRQHLNEDASIATEFDEVWRRLEDGELQVTGKGLGYLRTEQAWRDYHLVLEYQWNERTFAGRQGKARDGGLLFHIEGDDGAFGGTWPACLQAQLLEGGTGDLVALPTEEVAAGFTANAALAARPIWSPDASPQRFPLEGQRSAYLGWDRRSEDWKDIQGFRGEHDLENPVGEWNRLEIVSEGDRVEVRLNGEVVNRASEIHPAGGRVGLQTEFAAYRVRRFELHPLGSFDEEWAPEAGSTDMGYSITGESILPRRFPLSPEESLASWVVDGDYEVQLVASEPLIADPVDIAWDEHGRLFVAEMGDYPLPPDEDGYLSRIRLLQDRDGDGVMDSATTWAEGLDHVQGLQPLRGGLLVTTRTAILFLADTTGDDRADLQEILFHSNEPRHNQLQVSSPRYGLDNHIYLCNGLDGKEIYPAGNEEAMVEFTRLNLRYDLRSGEMKPSTGVGQFGGSLDAFGRHYFTSNRNPAMFAVMPLEAVRREPLAAITVGHEDLEPSASPVRPIALSHTTSQAHAGTYTAACGIAAYTGDLVPEFSGNLFVCEPTGQLVTRLRLEPKGASFSAERVGERREFLASSDEWTRPVQIRNGPDGALYVVDMYRRFIDHAIFFPDAFAESNYLRAGLDQGRIWRVVPRGTTPEALEPLPEDPDSLAELLTHANGWTRSTAQRLLLESGDASVAPRLEALLDASESAEATVHLLWSLATLESLAPERLRAALSHASPEVVENALLIAREGEREDEISDLLPGLLADGAPRVQFLVLALFPDFQPGPEPLVAYLSDGIGDTWSRKAAMSSQGASLPAALVSLLDAPERLGSDPGVATPALQDLARFTAGRGDTAEIAELLSRLAGDATWRHFAVVSGLSDGLRASPLPQRSLAALIAANPPELAEGLAHVASLLAEATAVALDGDRDEADRLNALALVAQQPWEEKVEAVERLIAPTESPAIQAAACRTFQRDDREKVAEFFFERWDSLPPAPLREALALITSNPKSGLALMRKMKAGEISPALMPPMTRWSYGRSNDEEIKALALELFGQAASDRSELVARYLSETAELEGDPERGRLVYERATCAACHRIGDLGFAVGPSLDDVRIKPDEALISDILDPNRAIEERWVGLTVETQGGRLLAGLVEAEDAESITLTLPGGINESVPRSEIVRITPSQDSLMPEGLEAAISPQDMADLLAFLKQP